MNCTKNIIKSEKKNFKIYHIQRNSIYNFCLLNNPLWNDCHDFSICVYCLSSHVHFPILILVDNSVSSHIMKQNKFPHVRVIFLLRYTFSMPILVSTSTPSHSKKPHVLLYEFILFYYNLSHPFTTKGLWNKPMKISLRFLQRTFF